MTNTLNPKASALERIDALPDFFKDKFIQWQTQNPEHKIENVYQMINLMETAHQVVGIQLVTGQSLDQIFRHINHHCPEAKNLDTRHLAGAYNMAILFAKSQNTRPVAQACARPSPMAALLLALSKGRPDRTDH